MKNYTNNPKKNNLYKFKGIQETRSFFSLVSSPQLIFNVAISILQRIYARSFKMQYGITILGTFLWLFLGKVVSRTLKQQKRWDTPIRKNSIVALLSKCGIWNKIQTNILNPIKFLMCFLVKSCPVRLNNKKDRMRLLGRIAQPWIVGWPRLWQSTMIS